MKIYTKRGDLGKTSLFGGGDFDKDDIRIEAYGTLDELNSFLGLLRDNTEYKLQDTAILRIQSRIFDIGANLATKPGHDLPMPNLPAEEIDFIEKQIDHMDHDLEPLKNFILPGGHNSVSLCHVCRTVCRRAERRIVSLARKSEIDGNVNIYLNRLSDYFFTLARTLSSYHKAEEIRWTGLS